MQRKPISDLVWACVVMLALAAGSCWAVLSHAHAQSSGYDLTWNTLDGGGWTFSAGGEYTLGGAIGQPDAGTLEGGGYTLVGGFWAGAAIEQRIYLPMILRG